MTEMAYYILSQRAMDFSFLLWLHLTEANESFVCESACANETCIGFCAVSTKSNWGDA